MAVNRQICRLSKIIAEREGITFVEAEARLMALTLDVFVGPNATTAAAHTAVLTTVNIASRSFLGGVSVSGNIEQPHRTALPVAAGTLSSAAAACGATAAVPTPRFQIVIGDVGGAATQIPIWWDGWQAGAGRPIADAAADNPLSAIAAAALGVGMAFAAAAGVPYADELTVSLWPATPAPAFAEVFLPGAAWLVGMGNLGQAYLWALTALPYTDPAGVELLLQDADRITEENWGTSVLVSEDDYGILKTAVAERWALAKGFRARRIDRFLRPSDRVGGDDPRVALSGLDRIEPRHVLGEVGFEAIVDAGLGRSAGDFDRYRVSVFDHTAPIQEFFAAQQDALPNDALHEQAAYRDLEQRIGRCGMAEIAGGAAAVPFVSALAAALAVARLIALASGQPIPTNATGSALGQKAARASPCRPVLGRSISRAGRPGAVP